VRKKRRKKKRLNSIIPAYYQFLKGLFTDLFDTKLSFYAASMSWSTIFFIMAIYGNYTCNFLHIHQYLIQVTLKLHDLIGQKSWFPFRTSKGGLLRFLIGPGIW